MLKFILFFLVWRFVVPYLYLKFYLKSIVGRAIVLYWNHVVSESTIAKATTFFKNHTWVKSRAPLETVGTYKLGRATMVFGDPDVMHKTPPKIWGLGATIHSWEEPEFSFVKEIKDQVERKLRNEGLLNNSFNVCLVNYYKNGKEFIGWHSDREELGDQHIIASVSIGAERWFSFRWKTDFVSIFSSLLKRLRLFQFLNNRRTVAKVKLENGSLLFMGKNCQSIYEHSLEREIECADGRLNLTFRRFHY